MPSITISPGAIARSSSPLAIGVTGSGFDPFERIHIYRGSLRVCSCSADKNGDVATAIPSPHMPSFGVSFGHANAFSITARGASSGSAGATLTLT